MNGMSFVKDYTCECGKKYKIYKMKLIIRDKDSEVCECGKTIIKWNGAVMYEARLNKDSE